MGMIKVFWGLKLSIPGFFEVGNFVKYFFKYKCREFFIQDNYEEWWLRSSSNKVESNLGSEIVTLDNAKQCSDPDCSCFKNKNL